MTAIGAYVGTTPADLTAYEQWLGRPLDNVLVSINQTGWDAFDSSIGYDVAQWDGTTTSTPIWSVPLTVTGTSLAVTATGADNTHYLKAAQAIAANQAGSGTIYIRVGWEFNIPGGQPWAAQGQEQAFIQSYQNLVNTFRSVSSRFKFVWDVNIGGGYNPALAYPGDKYVDVIGADMYYNPQYDGTDAAAAFQTKVTEQYGLQWQQDFAAAHGKPTAMSEWGVDTDTSGPYIQAAQQWFANHNMLYENYWESDAAYAGELHDGSYPDAGHAFQQAFGASSPPPTVSTATGSVSTAGLSGTGAVVVDLSGGFVTKAGAERIALSNVQNVQLGTDATTVYGLKSGTDTVAGGSGTVSFYGQGAADTITGGTGNATIMGGSGAESFTSGGGTNIMYGGTAANTMVGGTASSSQDTFYGKGGSDTVTGQGGTVTLYGGGGGTEKLNGGGGTNTLYGGSGTNILSGLMQVDSQGRGGTDILYGGTGASAGTDIVYAGIGNNFIYEGSGTDYIASDAGTVSVYGGSGQSFVYGGTGTESIYTGAGNQNVQTGYANTAFYDTAANLKAGRFDKIDGFSSAKDTEFYLPTAVQGATSFVAQNGGTAILTHVGPGSAEIFVSNASVAAVSSHTHFTL